jgi:transposase
LLIDATLKLPSVLEEEIIMAVLLPDARELSDDVLDALRLRAVRGCELGFTEAAVAQLLGVCRETVSRWWSAYTRDGLEALPHDRTGRPIGTGRTLSDQQAQQIQQQLDAHSPEDLGIPAPLWTRRAVQQLIAKEVGVAMPVRTVGLYLQRWGYTAKRPRRRAKKQDPEEIRQWLEETYPAIRRRAEAEGAEIHWCDETGVGADEYPACGYAPEGEPVTMAVPGPHIRMNQISTITNEGVVRFMTYPRTLNAALFLIFLGRLLRSTSGKLFVIVDRLRAHETPAVETWVAAHRDRIELFYLPRYAPELNATEYLNNDLKGQVNVAGLPDNTGALRSRMQRFMNKLRWLPQHVRNYFKHPCMLYAMAS